MIDKIEFIELKGFQSHMDTRVDLSNGMTALTGLSMEGKTAILRGFEFLKNNRPSGSKFRYKYEDIDTVVRVGVKGHVLTHIKSSKPLNKEGAKALYIINYPNGDTKEFSAYGTNVPAKVSEILNVSDISIQNQLDPYMLVTSTGGQIASTINKITGIDAADEWIKEIKTALRDIKTEVTVLNKSQKTITAELVPFEGIDDVQSSLLKARALNDQYDGFLRDANSILDLVDSIKANKAKLEAEKAILTGLNELMATDTRIAAEIEDITTANSALAIYQEAVDNQYGTFLELEFLGPEILAVETIRRKIDEVDEVNKAVRDLTMKSDQVKLAREALEQSKDDLALALIQSGECFVCGSELSDYDQVRSNI